MTVDSWSVGYEFEPHRIFLFEKITGIITWIRRILCFKIGKTQIDVEDLGKNLEAKHKIDDSAVTWFPLYALVCIPRVCDVSRPAWCRCRKVILWVLALILIMLAASESVIFLRSILGLVNFFVILLFYFFMRIIRHWNLWLRYVLLRLRVQNRRTKWNFPLNFRTMCKLSELYSGIFQTQLSGWVSGLDHFRNFRNLKILNI